MFKEKIPLEKVEQLNKFASVQRKLCLKLYREPTKEEMMKEMNISEKEYNELCELMDIPYKFPLKPHITAKQFEMIKDTLSPKELKALQYDYGFDGYPVKFEQDICLELDISLSKLRQIEAKITRKINKIEKTK